MKAATKRVIEAAVDADGPSRSASGAAVLDASDAASAALPVERAVSAGVQALQPSHPEAAVATGLHHDPLDRAAHASVAALTGGLSPASAVLAYLDWGMHLAISPGKCLDLALRASRDAAATWTAMLPVSTVSADGGSATASETARPQDASADPRFAGEAWSAWPFRVWRDTFLRTQQWWQDATTGVAGVDPHHADIVGFMARQCLDACSPGNFVATNPVVVGAALQSGGANFAQGFRHWMQDYAVVAKRLGGAPVREKLAYEPGKDVAITPGQVVWRNALCELLQYDPATPQVAREPVIVVPSWIMKYYILDLQPDNSLIRFLVGQGFTVFTLSWHNPDASARDLGLDDYLRAMLDALEAARARCGGAAAHAVGYCLGGTLLAIGAAALARDGAADTLRSVSLIAAQTDFSEPGELGLFIDASELAALDALMWRQGYLDGSQMAATFQLLNARDLVWSRMMSEYLLGRRSKANDLMSWNADTTRMPYRMHIDYLNDLFLHNDLAEGRYCVNGAPVALADIEQPMFVVGTERDHVSPWRSVYKLLLSTHGALTFLLTAGGHNAGIVSEPGHPRRHYRCATREPGAPFRGAQAFFDETAPVEGSWWPRFAAWLHERSSGNVAARDVHDGLEKAPGAYILER